MGRFEPVEQRLAEPLSRADRLLVEARLRERLGAEVSSIWSDDGIAIRLPDGAPNILIILLDDIGFGVSGVVTRARGIKASFPDLDTVERGGGKCKQQNSADGYRFHFMHHKRRTSATPRLWHPI